MGRLALAKKRKKHKHEEEVSESWLLPYADILTLLLALFIVLICFKYGRSAKTGTNVTSI